MFDEKDIDLLRCEISSRMSGFRLSHTLGVEKMAVRLGRMFLQDKIHILRAAALLHDITKENSFEKQLQICEKLGIIIPLCAKASPKTMHALTASAIIPIEFPKFASPEVVDAVRWHTTGRADMSLCEKLIYLADYIEEGRSFDDCVTLRNYFFEPQPEFMNDEDRLLHLERTLILSLDMTIKQLIDEGAVIDRATFEARNHLILSASGYDSTR